MKKFLLIFMAVFATAISMTAQTINMVRENVVWNYMIDYIFFDQWTDYEDNGYHFQGSKEVDGQTYSIYLNGEDEEVALIRQKDGKVYRHLDGILKETLMWQKAEIENYDETYGSEPSEILLYNLDAEVGDSYYIPIFDLGGDDITCLGLFTVDVVETGCINGENLKFQHLTEGYTVVEGVGPSQGMLHRPQFGWLNTGFHNHFAYLNTLRTSDGELLFRRPYFNYGNQPYSVTRDHTNWEYSGTLGGNDSVDFSYRMYFAGTEVTDNQVYKVLSTMNGKEIRYDGATSDFQTSDIENGLKFLMREEYGKVYIHAPLGSVEEGYSPWNIEEREALLYDFNAKVGYEMEVMGSSGNLLNGVVTSTFTVNIDNFDCRGYTILFEELNREFTVIEWLGNITAGCLPYFLDDVSDEAIDGSLTYLPVNNRMQRLDKITYYDGDVICEKDADGLWPWEKTEGVAAVETASRLSFDGKAISAESEYMTIYTLSGNAVAKGFDKVSTESLQPGVYVAKAGTKTLKILVR